eukprot:TRINITY_DN44647_c0_g1_i4.p2 TRINITY_DN44647_c0_g1~~TRINITY_DN44647_c0_g1_i4.p2  ORF type:complete len:106 (-),score=5.97 TRINITY_DN44647_c0_g1_i4:10-327(-)
MGDGRLRARGAVSRECEVRESLPTSCASSPGPAPASPPLRKRISHGHHRPGLHPVVPRQRIDRGLELGAAQARKHAHHRRARQKLEIGRAVQQECRDRSRMPSSA